MTSQAPTTTQSSPLSTLAVTTQVRRSSRLTAIDVVRGIFMVIILAGHTGAELNDSKTSKEFQTVFQYVVLSGTVGFTAVSGTLFGTFLATRPSMGSIIARYRQQALRLLTVAHLLIGVALYLPLRKPGDTFLHSLIARHYVTDVLAVIFLLVVPFLPRVPARARLFAGVGLMIAARVWVASRFCTEGDWLLVRELFVGVDTYGGRRILIDNYPFLPLLGMFLIGTFAGDHIGRHQKEGDLEGASRGLLRAASRLPLLTFAFVGLWALHKFVLHGGRDAWFRVFFYPSRSFSLFPMDLSFVLVLLAFFLHRDARKREMMRAEAMLELLGKTSLFTYVIQYVLAQTIPALVGLQGTMGVKVMVVWMIVALGAAYAAAWLWNRYVKRA